MRLFLAIDLPADVRSDVAAKARQLRERVEGSAPGGFKWVADENLHLTLHFIGHVDEAREAAIRASIGTDLPIAPFEVVLAAAGSFPDHGHPRVIWIGVTAGSESLRRVHDILGVRLETVGVVIETRPYSAHLTVARAREMRDRRRDGRKLLTVRGESPASTETGDAPGSPGATLRLAQGRPEPVEWATSEHIGPYVSEEQRREFLAGSPTRVSQRVGVQEGCSAGRMPAEFHDGLSRRDILDAPGDTMEVRWRVDAVTLFESHLSSKGPRYTPRARLLLRAPAETDRPLPLGPTTVETAQP